MSPGNGLPLLPKCQGKVTAFIKNKCWREDVKFVFTAGTLIQGHDVAMSLFLFSGVMDASGWCCLMDVGSCLGRGGPLGQGCRLPGQVATFGWDWREGSGCPVTGQNWQVYPPPIRCRWPVGESWLLIGKGVFCSWWRPADWVGRGRTFGRSPPFCPRMGPLGVGMMMECL